jgi:hypothetical protein
METKDLANLTKEQIEGEIVALQQRIKVLQSLPQMQQVAPESRKDNDPYGGIVDSVVEAGFWMETLNRNPIIADRKGTSFEINEVNWKASDNKFKQHIQAYNSQFPKNRVEKTIQVVLVDDGDGKVVCVVKPFVLIDHSDRINSASIYLTFDASQQASNFVRELKTDPKDALESVLNQVFQNGIFPNKVNKGKAYCPHEINKALISGIDIKDLR